MEKINAETLMTSLPDWSQSDRKEESLETEVRTPSEREFLSHFLRLSTDT